MAQKLFQHIVSEPEVRGSYEKIKAETVKVFKGQELFHGIAKVYTPKEEGGEPLPKEEKDVVTTVEKRLHWTEGKVAGLFDYELVRDRANMKAMSDLTVDGVTIAKDVPATTLLSMEKRLREIREYYDAIPTLDLSKKWDNVDGAKDLFRNGPNESYRTAKKTLAVVLYPATEKHPAQVKDVTEDVTVGTWRTTYFSGAIHPGVKAELLERIDRLIEAAKKARMKANEVETEKAEIGKALFDYIHKR